MHLIQKVTQILLGTTLIFTGILHLTTSRGEFQAQVPTWLSISPDVVVVASGIVELVLGLSLISLQRRRQVGITIALFFIVIFPGNISQYINHIDAFGLDSNRARAIRLLFQPLLVLWALWSTSVLPKGILKRSSNYAKKAILENRAATVIGILIGGVGTRFLEDGNLLVTTLLTGMSLLGVLVAWINIKKLTQIFW